MIYSVKSLLLYTPLLVAAASASLRAADANALPSQAAAALQRYCYDCHVGSGAEGGIELDFLAADQPLDERVEVVEKAIRVLKEQEMPPSDAEALPATERVALIEAIEGRLEAFDCGSVSRPGRVTIRRLNRQEYDNTIRDLTGLDLQLADDFPSDDVGNGFDNIGDVLSLPPILLEKYVDAAGQVADRVLADPQARQRLFPAVAENPKDLQQVAQAARANVTRLATMAFRRPVTEAESERLFELMRGAWQAGVEPDEIMRTAIMAILASPNFIYRVEDDEGAQFEDGVRSLTDFELASRLSYFLWSSMPDERLFRLAQRGELHLPEQLTAEVQRMLADPKAQALVENFAGQWLQLRDLAALSPDPQTYPEFDEALRQSMRRETELLFAHIISADRSILDLLDADYTFLNQRLAEHYGMAGVSGGEFKKVALPEGRRGVLMHASILLITSNPTRTSPVKRGKWVLDNLLGEPPPPPPPDVPELGQAGETLGTLRQQMEQHRADPNCAVCHTKMDALGFGLENFDGIGQWREQDGRTPIDPAGSLPGGRAFAGPVELVKILAEDKREEFSRCMTKKLLTYALGRGLNVSDRCTVNQIVSDLADGDYRFSVLVKSIVTSPPFMTQEQGR